MSVSTVCASGDVGNLAAQQTGHHLDAGERVLHLVRDHGRHLADGGEPVAQPLAFLELLDARQVLEEHRRADHARRRRRGRAPACSRSPCSTASAASRRGSAGGAGRRRRPARGPRRDDRWRTCATGCPTSSGCAVDAEDAVGLVVDERQPAVARNGQHAVAHAGHDVPEERVVDRRRAARGRPRAAGRTVVARRRIARREARDATWPLRTDSMKQTSAHSGKGQRLCPVPNLAYWPAKSADSRGVSGQETEQVDYGTVSRTTAFVTCEGLDLRFGRALPYDSDWAACSCRASHCAIRSPTSHISAWCRSMTCFDASRSS